MRVRFIGNFAATRCILDAEETSECSLEAFDISIIATFTGKLFI